LRVANAIEQEVEQVEVEVVAAVDDDRNKSLVIYVERDIK